MKSFKQHIIEAKQVGILYHYTSLYGLLRILQDNKIHRGKFSYVSLTRDKFFHKHGRFGISLDVRLILDGDKLSNNYKIKPFNYWQIVKDKEPKESEERLNKNLENLNEYLIGIEFQKQTLEKLYLLSKAETIKIENLIGNNVTKENILDFIRQFYVKKIGTF